jgi:DNA polymerase-3 subunit gamma/tau
MDVAGQEHISATLKNAIKNNRIAHAYLFTGPRGVGKTTTARIFAKSLNCLNPVDAEPCNECEMCLSISSTQSMDIIEIDGASNRGIDEIRTLRESVKYAPAKGKYKIYIIDEVHMLTKESFNAFLKTLEEPPAHTIFIFATTDVHKVPLTIISRCQRFDFRRIQLDTIKSTLSKIALSEQIEIDDKTLTIIAKKADGALRDAESFFDQIVSFCGNKIEAETVSKMLNLVDDEIYFRISDAVLTKDFKAVFDVTKSIYENGWDFIDFMNGLTEHFRNIMTVILTQKTDLVETAEVYRNRYLNYIGNYSEGDILRLLNFLNKTQQELRFAQNHRLKIEIALSHLIGLEKTSTLSEILSIVEGNHIDISSSQQSSSNRQNSVAYSQKTSYPEPAKESKNHSKPVSVGQIASPLHSAAGDISFNFDSVVKKWEGFVDSVNAEKGLILGPFMKSIKPVGLDGNKLHLLCKDDHGKDLLSHQQEYISKKAIDFFGKKLTFHLTSEGFIRMPDPQVQEEEEERNSQPEVRAVKERQQHDDPFDDFITNEMGGEEIS